MKTFASAAGLHAKNPHLILAGFGLALFCFYLSLFFIQPPGIFWSLDEAGKFIYLKSVMETGRADTALLYPGERLDPGHQFIPLYYAIQKGGQTFSWWPAGLPLASLPFYALFGWLGLYLLPAAGGAATSCIAGMIAKKASGSQKTGVLAALVTGLATPVTFYSTRFWEHTLSSAACLAALYCILKAIDTKRSSAWVLAGMFAAISIFFRLDTAPLLAGFGIVLLFKNWKHTGLYAASTALASIPGLAVNQWTSGHPLGPTFDKVSAGQPFTGLNQAGLKFIPYALFNPPRADTFIFDRALLLAASLLLFLGVLFFLFRQTRWITAGAFAGLAAISAWVLFQPSLYQAVHGIVLIAPQILFGLFLFAPYARKNTGLFPALVLSALVTYSLVYVRFGWVSAGGLQWGPRYLLTIYPLLVICALVGIGRLRQASPGLYSFAVIIFAAGCLVGAGFQVRGLYTARAITRLYDQATPTLLAIQDAPVLISEVYVMNNSDLYWSGNFFKAPGSEEGWDAWNAALKNSGKTYYYSVDVLVTSNAPVNEIANRASQTPGKLILSRVEVQP